MPGLLAKTMTVYRAGAIDSVERVTGSKTTAVADVAAATTQIVSLKPRNSRSKGRSHWLCKFAQVPPYESNNLQINRVNMEYRNVLLRTAYFRKMHPSHEYATMSCINERF